MKGKSENIQNIYIYIYIYILDLMILHNKEVSAQIFFEKLWRFGYSLKEGRGLYNFSKP